MMSRQDFVTLAEALLSVKKDISSKHAEVMRDKIIAAISVVCANANWRFDLPRFIDACNGAPYNPPRRRRRVLGVLTQQELNEAFMRNHPAR